MIEPRVQRSEVPFSDRPICSPEAQTLPETHHGIMPSYTLEVASNIDCQTLKCKTTQLTAINPPTE